MGSVGMKTVYPSYFPEFRCIADRCGHSCCIGWEIDIDSDTLTKYRSVSGEIGSRLCKSISVTDGCACFTLGKDERCPFLNKKGLCDIITELGEDYLCEICSDHPRFRSFFSERTEIGLGLCCEEAARVILNRSEKASLVEEGEGDANEIESELLHTRSIIFDILQNRETGIDERLSALEKRYSLENIHSLNVKKLYKSLETLDKSWPDMLDLLPDGEKLALPDNTDIQLEQLAVYFIYRHLPEVIYGASLRETIGFCLLSTYLIGTLCRHGIAVEEAARMYSSEIEYSDENPAIIMEEISSLI